MNSTNKSDDEIKQLAQRATALFQQSSATNKQSSALAEESARLNKESVRLYGEAKKAGFLSKGKLNEQAKSYHAEGSRLLTEAKNLHEKGNWLAEEGDKLLEEAKWLKSQAPVSESSVNYVTCRCQHCDTGIQFDANQLAEENSNIPCPHCGLETKLFIPPVQ